MSVAYQDLPPVSEGGFCQFFCCSGCGCSPEDGLSRSAWGCLWGRAGLGGYDACGVVQISADFNGPKKRVPGYIICNGGLSSEGV